MTTLLKLNDLVIWQDEQTNDITGIITQVNNSGFRILWDVPSQSDIEKNEIFYLWDFLNYKTPSGKPVIQLDIPRIREEKINNILI